MEALKRRVNLSRGGFPSGRDRLYTGNRNPEWMAKGTESNVTRTTGGNGRLREKPIEREIVRRHPGKEGKKSRLSAYTSGGGRNKNRWDDPDLNGRETRDDGDLQEGRRGKSKKHSSSKEAPNISYPSKLGLALRRFWGWGIGTMARAVCKSQGRGAPSRGNQSTVPNGRPEEARRSGSALTKKRKKEAGKKRSGKKVRFLVPKQGSDHRAELIIRLRGEKPGRQCQRKKGLLLERINKMEYQQKGDTDDDQREVLV